MNEKRYILGIDIGHRGALVVMDVHEPKLISYIDMPLKVGTRKKELNLEVIKDFIELWKDKTAFAVLEDVHAMPGQGVVSMFTFGEQKGAIIGTLTVCGVEIRKVQPAVWKAGMGLETAAKEEALEMAQKLIPKSRVYFLRKKDDGRAEAALMAMFGKRIL